MKSIAARWFTRGRISPIRVVVIHSMEAPEGPQTAENVANYFRTTSTKASAHVNVDNNSAVRSVADANTAWAAPGANADGLQLELAGYARQNREQWLDAYSRDLLQQAAKVTAEWCRKYDIPARRLTRAELKAGKKGVTSHVDVSAVYKRSDHHDPGPGFPWDHFLAAVKNELSGEEKSAPPVSSSTETPEPPPWPGRYLRLGVEGDDVRTWQRRMRVRGWGIAVDGIYGVQSRDVCVRFQREKDLYADGVVGPITWEAAWEEPIT
jgi:N-acetyl-anhydromuramyl-L-alanine amidase AmpD